MLEPTYTIAEFCRAEKISRGRLYKLWDRGEGPRSYLSFPKIPSGLDSHCKAESSHH
jgi:hypothetical protein